VVKFRVKGSDGIDEPLIRQPGTWQRRQMVLLETASQASVAGS
jgi:hypothetical protein